MRGRIRAARPGIWSPCAGSVSRSGWAGREAFHGQPVSRSDVRRGRWVGVLSGFLCRECILCVFCHFSGDSTGVQVQSSINVRSAHEREKRGFLCVLRAYAVFRSGCLSARPASGLPWGLPHPCTRSDGVQVIQAAHPVGIGTGTRKNTGLGLARCLCSVGGVMPFSVSSGSLLCRVLRPVSWEAVRLSIRSGFYNIHIRRGATIHNRFDR